VSAPFPPRRPAERGHTPLKTNNDRVLLDDTDVTGTRGGHIHERYGISRSAGALVVVRPDGYVGTIVPLDNLAALDTYFAGFMRSR
jgi:phenol 2-monooxygenase